MKVYTDFEKDGILFGELVQYLSLGTKIDLSKLNPNIKKILIKVDRWVDNKLLNLINLLIEKGYIIIVEIPSDISLNEPASHIIKISELLSIVVNSFQIPVSEHFNKISNLIMQSLHSQIKISVSNENELKYAIDLSLLINNKHPYTLISILLNKDLKKKVKKAIIGEELQNIKVIEKF